MFQVHAAAETDKCACAGGGGGGAGGGGWPIGLKSWAYGAP